jgi:phosphoserine phosphatase RsbU/P
VVRAHDGRVAPLASAGGPPLGPFDGASYAGGRGTLEPGDTLVLYTDGITEAEDGAHGMFGVEGLAAALAGSHRGSLPGAKARLLASLDAHTGGAPPGDDTTLLMLRRHGPHDGRRPEDGHDPLEAAEDGTR